MRQSKCFLNYDKFRIENKKFFIFIKTFIIMKNEIPCMFKK